jgi:hypothetical protein
MLLLDKPVEQAADSKEISYCHTVCRCHPYLTLCGAYKPKLCGTTYLDTLMLDRCPACHKVFCPDCDDLAPKGCLRCNN